MCVYSMISDHYIDKWKEQNPVPQVSPVQYVIPQLVPYPLTQQEVDEVRKLLQKAKEYDEKNNQKDCGIEDKKKLLKKLAKELGFDLEL